MKRYLVVANQTAAGPALQHAIRECIAAGECTFTLVVPATHPRDHLAWTEGTAYGLARRRLQDTIERLRAIGATIDGWVGDENCYRAIADGLEEHGFDEVILSTFSQDRSRWLRQDVASRIRQDYDVAVRVVESDRVPITVQ
jgi:hypothetical protein